MTNLPNGKTNKGKYVWYASYGSNILEERFLCYIQGGQPVGSAKRYDGCDDKSLPVDKEEIYISSELYFAKKSKSWENGGVGFININFEQQQQTLGRMYLITREQFVDVVKQETENEDLRSIDFEKAIAEGSLVFRESSWYGNLIYLGIRDEFPIFTFTNHENITPTNKPSKNYLLTIIRGIKESYTHLNNEEIVDYLITKKGVDGNYGKTELFDLIPQVK